MPGGIDEVMDDDELIASLAGGDDMALRQLFDRHAPWLAARLRKALPPDDVEDVLQETFLAVWKNAGTYQPRGTPAAWLWVIARNQAALLLRKRGPATQALLDEGGPVSDPAEAAATRTDLDVAAAAALGPPGCPDRELWRLMYEEGRPVAEVAELMGVPEGTVKSRVHRVRRLLRAALGGVQ
ncbi:MAG TPA: RNA polymerase sigma factor [Streptosporangiaceae bacterium]|nr:RNA polymerase sigma factor [Streptosporangiaceae bacterium]